MKTLSVAVLLASIALAPAAANAHDVWITSTDVVAPSDVLVDGPVWVNPGVYVGQDSDVRRDYPYVGCCLPAYENSSYMRPYPSGFGIRANARAGVRHSRRHAMAERPRSAHHLYYPDGERIERFR